ncbi:MAG: autotransporter-associated beta strand repeat-containing protein [Chthoniobacteraceae bacterium]
MKTKNSPMFGCNTHTDNALNQRKPHRLGLARAAAPLAASILTCLALDTAHAASSTWSGGGSDGSWIASGNWNGSVISGTTTGYTNTDTAVFNNNANTTVTLDNYRNLQSIVFDTGAGAYTLTGGTLQMTGFISSSLTPGVAQIQMNSAVANPQVINSSIVINAGGAANNSGALKISNNASSSSATMTISGGITGGTSASQNKADILVLGGANTGANVVSGNISNGSSSVAIEVVKADSGNWTLSGSNSYTQGTLVLNGMLTISGTANATVGSGTSAFTVDGGILKITGTTSTGSGSVNINGGTLALDFSGANAPTANIISTTSPLTMTGGTLSLTGGASASTVYTQTFASGALSAGNNTIVLNQNGAADLNLSLGSVSRSTGATLNVVLPTSGTVSLSGPSNMNGIAASGNTAFITINGSDWATASSGTLGKYSGYSTGTASYTTTNNIDVGAADSVSNVTVNTLRLNQGASTLTLAGVNTLYAGSILVTSAGAGSAITGGTIRAGTGKEVVIIDNGSLNVNSTIADSASGASSLTFSGTGTTTVNSANTYTGATYINSGTVKVANAAAFGTTGTSVLSPAGGTLDVNGYNLSFGSLNAGVLGSGGAGTAGIITNSAASGTATLTLGGSALSGTFTGSIQDGANAKMGLTKTGTNQLYLAGINTYTGDTTVTGGQLHLEFSYGNSTNIINPNSKLVLNGAGIDLATDKSGAAGAFNSSQTFNSISLQGGDSVIGTNRSTSSYLTQTIGSVNRVTGSVLGIQTTAGSKIATATASTNLVNTNGIVGGWLVDSGMTTFISLNSGTFVGATLTADAFTTAAANVTTSAAASTLATGTCNSITLKSSSNITMTLTGVTTVQSGGILQSSDSNYGKYTYTFNGGTLTSGTNELFLIQANTSGSTIINSVIADNSVSAVSVVKSGPGALFLGGANTFTGGIYINSGTLVLTNANALNGNVVTLGNGSIGAGAITSYAGVLSLNGNSATVGGLATSNTTLTPVVENNNATAAALTINTTGTNTYGGTVRNGAAAGALSLIKNGAGTQILTGTNTYTGTTQVNAGVLQLTTTSALPSMTALTVANGGTLAVNAGGSGQWTSGNISTLLSSGTFCAGSSLGIDTTGGNFTYDSLTNTANGALGLTKFGSNTLTLTGNNSYSGPTAIMAGTLAVSGSLTGNGSLRVASGAAMVNTGKTTAVSVNIEANASLVNSGTISGPVTVAGHLTTGGLIDGALKVSGSADLAIGSNPSTATVNGDLTIQTGGLLSLRVNSSTSYDQLIVTSGHSVNLNTGSILSLTLDTALADGQLLTLIDNQGTDTIHGTFTSLYIGGNIINLNANNTFTYGLQTYELDYNAGTGDNDLILTIAAVPEPSTWAMIVGGLGLMAFGERKRCRKA